MTELKVPSVAESITEVTLSRYLVKDGDYVELDQPICELETDKASQEIPATVAGVVKFVAKEGADLKVGAVICMIDEKAAKPAATAKADVPKVEEKKVTSTDKQSQKESPQTKNIPEQQVVTNQPASNVSGFP